MTKTLVERAKKLLSRMAFVDLQRRGAGKRPLLAFELGALFVEHLESLDAAKPTDDGPVRRAEAIGGRLMPVALLRDRHDGVRLLYRAPGRGARVAVRVEATRAVDVFVLPEDALEDFEDERPFDCYRESRRDRAHQFRFTPEPGEEWYLVIDSCSDDPTSVFYEVTW